MNRRLLILISNLQNASDILPYPELCGPKDIPVVYENNDLNEDYCGQVKECETIYDTHDPKSCIYAFENFEEP
jgi:hypothetical protein